MFKILKGAALHYGTWQSGINIFANMSELRPIREELFAEPYLPKPKFKLNNRCLLNYDNKYL
jgi:hypothetical protein